MATLSPQLIDQVRKAQHIVVLTGAGISAESGVPTFRDAQTGLWAQYDPQELATPDAFARDPKLVWEWYAWRRELVAEAKPNAGHYALVEMAKHAPKFTLITQNIDNLHQEAGSDPIIELHGNLKRIKGAKSGRIYPKQQWETFSGTPPQDPTSGEYMRPDVVWFGEMLSEHQLSAAIDASLSCDIYFSIGTSSVVHPAASLVVNAIRNHAKVVEINPNETPLTDHATHAIAAPSGEILPDLVTAVWGN